MQEQQHLLDTAAATAATITATRKTKKTKRADKVAAEHDPDSSSDRCKFFLQRKKRYCSWPVKPGHQYCGNHLFEATGAGQTRVPCPAAPNHHVPIDQLSTHLNKCPEAVHQAALRAQSYFSENINAGADESYGPNQLQDRSATAAAAGAALADATAAATGLGPAEAAEVAAAALAAAAAAGLIPTGPEATAVAAVAAEAAAPFLKGVAEGRQATAVALGPEGFAALLAKVDKAHAALTAAYPLQSRKLKTLEGAEALKEQCKAFDKLMPCDTKHGLQNASIVGNMSAAGLLQQPDSTIFMELGAGKGWLTAWLHMLNPSTQEFILLDKFGHFHNKADRRLRHTNLTRVAIDLKDAALPQLLQLHLSPPADLPEENCSSHNKPVVSRNNADLAADSARSASASEADATANGKESSGSGKKAVAGSAIINLGGLVRVPKRLKATEAAAVAAVGSAEQQQQQQVVPWVVCGKHLCGAATDFALRGCYNALIQQQQQQQQCKQQQQQQLILQGLAIASCCHHRCGWMSYTGREALQAAAGIVKDDFEVIAWLTGWALCGHDAAAGAADEAGDGDGDSSHDAVSTDLPTAAAAASSGVPNDTACCDCSCVQQQQHHHQAQQQAGRDGAWHPANGLTHQQRIQLGKKCKQLLDAGRCAWMQQQLVPLMQQQQQQQQCLAAAASQGGIESSLQVGRFTYIDESISGENTLLVVGAFET